MSTLIKLEDVQNILDNDNDSIVTIDTWDKINSLPQYNPEEVLREMIVHTLTKPEDPRTDAQISILQELLNKLPK